ncbi:MAG TPA: HAD family hydrolase [Polyangiaceae bacterium]
MVAGPESSSIDAVLFDLDGTLVLSPIDFPAMRGAVRALATEEGVLEPLSAPDVLGLVREASELVRDRPRFCARADAAILELELEAARGARPAPGVETTLAALHRGGVRIGIVTRNARSVAAALLARFDLPHDVLVAREDTPRPKPAPMHLRRALVLLGVPKSRAVFVGDHAMDALGGRRAGLRTFGVPTGAPDAFAAAQPDVMLGRLDEVLDHLGRAVW